MNLIINKKAILTLYCILILVYIANAQTKFEWAKQLGGLSGDGQGNSIALDSFGNIYTTGSFRGTVDFDPGNGIYNLTADSLPDIFISKLDPSGNFIWAKKMGGTSYEFANSIALDKYGNVYTTGLFFNEADFDPGDSAFFLKADSSGHSDIFISKLDLNGNFIWAKKAGGSGFDRGLFITVDKFNNVYLTGSFTDSADFNPDPINYFKLVSKGQEDIFILKLDASGIFEWAASIGGETMYDIGNSIATDMDGNIYTTGIFRGVIDFNPGAGTYELSSTNDAGGVNIFILKLDSSGTFIWAKNMGSIDGSGYSIAIDPLGNILTTGYFYGDADFDPDSGNSYDIFGQGYDIFISKLNASGKFLWAKSIGANDNRYNNKGNSITVDVYGNSYIAGTFEGIKDFDPGDGIFYLTATDSSIDMFILKLDTSGNFVWAKRIGGSSDEYSQSVVIDASGSIYSTGGFGGTVDFDPGKGGIYNMTSAGGRDIFVHKMNICQATSSVFSADACKTYTLNDQKYRYSGIYRQTITNSVGCDSIIILNLTIHTNYSIYQVGSQLIVNEIGAFCQWVKCPAYSIISGATGRIFTPTENGEYAVIVTQNGCTDTSTCWKISGLGIDDILLSNVLIVYPNPSSGIFNITLSHPPVGSTIEVYNTHGALVFKQTNIEEVNTVNLNEYANGLYFVVVRYSKQIIFAEKILKQ